MTDAVRRQVEQSLASRFLDEGLSADLGHPAVASVVTFLLWDSVSRTGLLAWLGLIVALTVMRFLLRRALSEEDEPGRVVKLMGGAAVSLAWAWGVGMLVLAVGQPVVRLSVLVVVFAGLTAAATATLIPSPAAFYGFLAGLMAPLGALILLSGTTGVHLELLALEGLFAVVMAVLYRRSRAEVVARYRTAALLRSSEEEIAAERDFAQAVLETAPVAVAIEGDQGVQQVNPEFLTVFGYREREEVLGSSLGELVDLDGAEEQAREFMRRAHEGERVVDEFRVKRADDRPLWVRVAVAPGRGVAEGTLVFMAQDVTRRKQAEEAVREAEREYRELVESSPDLVFRLDPEGRFTYLNPAARDVYDRDPEDLLGSGFLERVPPERMQADLEFVERVMKGDPVEDHETVHLSVDGTRRTLSISGHPVLDPEGEIMGLQGIARDVSRRVEEREALEAAREAAERAARARTAFLASMSHEIRTPLNGVLGMLEILLDTELDPEQRDAASTALSSGETLLAILNDVLDFTKIEAGQMELDDAPFDISEVVGGALRILAVRAEERGTELNLDVGPNVPLWVRGDGTRLRQVITNLAGNAVKFTEDGEVTLEVRLVGAAEGRPVVRFSVKDTGVGIPDEKIDRIFREFGQADSSVNRQFGGTGLGLNISRRLVDLMGGDLSVVSRVGEGSEFWFTVPLAVAEGSGASELAAGTRLAGRRILVVDDNETNRRIVREAVEQAGGECLEATTSEEALAVLREAGDPGRPVDGVVLDLVLGDEDGLELARTIRNDPGLGGVLILVLASALRSRGGDRARDLDVEGYLTKPVSRPDLVRALTGIFREKESLASTEARPEEESRSLRILLAEDNRVNQQVAAAILRKKGWTVEVANDGAEAVRAVEEDPFDLVLMDVQMPGVDGLEATRRIRESDERSDVPIVALTAHALESERRRCLEAGMNDFLSKPFKPDELTEMIERWTSSEPESADDSPAPEGPADETEGAGEPPVRLEEFRALMREAGVEEVVEPSIASYLEEGPARIEALEAALEEGDGQAVASAAHALKSGSRNLRADTLGDLLDEIEGAGREGDLDTARRMGERAVEEYERVRDYLQSELER